MYLFLSNPLIPFVLRAKYLGDDDLVTSLGGVVLSL
jgi:hypothetical protein